MAKAKPTKTDKELLMEVSADISALESHLAAAAQATAVRAAADAYAKAAEPEDEPHAFPGYHAPGPAQLLHTQLVPSPLNPRKTFDEEGLAELAASLAEHGLMQNLVVRPKPDEPYAYWIVAGERRWRAVGLAIASGQWPESRRIPVQVRHMSDGEHAALALIENLQRRDLKPLEEAEGLKALMDATGEGTADIAQKIGFTQRYVQQRLQLLELAEDQKAQLNEGKLTIEAARQWLAARPKPIEISDADALEFLEISHHLAGVSNGVIWKDAPVDAAAEPSEANKPRVYLSESYQTGGKEIRLRYEALALLEQLTGSRDLKAGSITPTIRKLRTQLGHEGKVPTPYVTDWLNPPFAVDPEKKAVADARAEEARRQKEENERRWEAEREAADRRRSQAEAASVQAAELVQTFESATDRADKIAAALDAVAYPLPWTFVADAGNGWGPVIRAANGEDISLGDDDGVDVLARLVMASVNAVAGHPPIVAEPEPEPDEEADDESADSEDDEGEPALAGDAFSRQLAEVNDED